MPKFVIESYIAAQPASVTDALARARRTAELADGVSYLRTTFVPSDETCFHLFDAPSLQMLVEAARLGALSHLRIVEAVEMPAPPQREGSQ